MSYPNLTNELIQAYQQAKYIVCLQGGEFTLRVGHLSADMDFWLKKNDEHIAAFITPENPFSEEFSANENAIRHQLFKEE